MHAGGVLHVDISTRHQPKSLTDQRLTLTAIEKADALAGANHAHTTTAFVIVSNDKDFIPLHSELRRRGLQPVAAGYTATFSAEVRAVAAHTIMLPSPASAAAPKAPYAAPRPHAITLPASRGKLLCALAQENAHAEAAAAPPETQDSFEYALAELQSCTQELAGALGETILGPSEPAPSLRAKSWVDVATSEAHGASERSQPGNSCANSKLAWAELLEDVSKGVTAAQAARAAAVQEMSAAAACTELSAKLQCCSALSFNGLWHAVCADLPHLAELRHEQGVTFKHFIIGGLVGLRDGWTDVDRQKLVELLLLGPRNAKSCLHWLDGAFPAQIGKRLVVRLLHHRHMSTFVLRTCSGHAGNVVAARGVNELLGLCDTLLGIAAGQVAQGCRRDLDNRGDAQGVQKREVLGARQDPSAGRACSAVMKAAARSETWSTGLQRHRLASVRLVACVTVVRKVLAVDSSKLSIAPHGCCLK